MQSNEKDWVELEKWQEEKEQEKNKKIHNKISSRTKIWYSITSFINRIGKIPFILISIIVISFTVLTFIYMKSRFFIDVIEKVSNLYDKEFVLISKDLDKRENGIYTVRPKDNNEITFYVLRDHGELRDDYFDRCQKYYFDKWQSQNKKMFETTENIRNGLLNYINFIEIKNEDEISNAIKVIKEFIDFCDGNFHPTWGVELKINGFQIPPFGDTPEKSVEDATNFVTKIYRTMNTST